MTVLRYILGALLALFFLGTALANACVFAKFFLHGKRSSSIPIIGGTAGFLALLLLPIPGPTGIWWLPFILDPGCLLWGILVAYVALRKQDSSTHPR